MGTIGYGEFLNLLAVQFPEVADEIRAQGENLLHLDIATFRRATERAMDTGQLWAAEKHFRFVERALNDAAPDVEKRARSLIYRGLGAWRLYSAALSRGQGAYAANDARENGFDSP